MIMALLALKLIARDGETFHLTPEAEPFVKTALFRLFLELGQQPLAAADAA
ncbi:hypothetical protein M8494_18920 [Serratia ureilytica]